jgi:hypothetical protein
MKRAVCVPWRRCTALPLTTLAVVLCAAGCGTLQQGALASEHSARFSPGEPDWFTGGSDRYYAQNNYIVGVAACGDDVPASERPSCAEARALERAVLAIRQRISVVVKRSTTVEQTKTSYGASGTVGSRFEQGSMSAAELELENVRAREAVCADDGTCYALVAIERADIAARARRRIESLDPELSMALERAASTDVLTAISALDAAEQVATRMEREADLLVAVMGPAAAPDSPLDRVAQARRARLGALSLCLTASGTDIPSTAVFARARESLASRGFANMVVAGADGCAASALFIEFAGSLEYRPATEEATWCAEVRGTLSVSSGQLVLGGGGSVLGRGIARTKERALSDAVDDLGDQVDKGLASIFEAPRVATR